ncbi:hypothetical protein CO229_00145 [Mycoplasmopsis bovirhinis]|uniref:hypothetical protein n=1 Tax=Mycoplasmopsis bovirhinis TaxID=29553 RepID=UPI000C05C6A3|nr:hypothetical protein [Mycoplasmopsis bovirhinis]ATO30548.1 hypothetical protein CO229_00145 [Mycoplasmopsis bovirhinis]
MAIPLLSLINLSFYVGGEIFKQFAPLTFDLSGIFISYKLSECVRNVTIKSSIVIAKLILSISKSDATLVKNIKYSIVFGIVENIFNKSSLLTLFKSLIKSIDIKLGNFSGQFYLPQPYHLAKLKGMVGEGFFILFFYNYISL